MESVFLEWDNEILDFCRFATRTWPLRSVHFLSDSDETDEEGAAYRRLRIDSDNVSYWEDILMCDLFYSALAVNHKVSPGPWVVTRWKVVVTAFPSYASFGVNS